jgi:hypothetical protein
MDTQPTVREPGPEQLPGAPSWAVSICGRGEHLAVVRLQVEHNLPAAYGFAVTHTEIPLIPGRVVVTTRARMVLTAVFAGAAHSGARGRLGRARAALRLGLDAAGQYLRADSITCYARDGEVTVLIDASAILLKSPDHLLELLAGALVKAAQMQAEGRFELYRRCTAALARRRYAAPVLAAARHLSAAEEDQVARVVLAVRERLMLSAEPRRQALLDTALDLARNGAAGS